MLIWEFYLPPPPLPFTWTCHPYPTPTWACLPYPLHPAMPKLRTEWSSYIFPKTCPFLSLHLIIYPLPQCLLMIAEIGEQIITIAQRIYLAVSTFRIVTPYSYKSIITSGYNQVLFLWMISCSIDKTWMRICLCSRTTVPRHFPTPAKWTQSSKESEG
jgi:hypothetical protein